MGKVIMDFKGDNIKWEIKGKNEKDLKDTLSSFLEVLK